MGGEFGFLFFFWGRICGGVAVVGGNVVPWGDAVVLGGSEWPCGGQRSMCSRAGRLG